MPIKNWGIILNQFLTIFEKGFNFNKAKPSIFKLYTLCVIMSYQTDNTFVSSTISPLEVVNWFSCSLVLYQP